MAPDDGTLVLDMWLAARALEPLIPPEDAD